MRQTHCISYIRRTSRCRFRVAAPRDTKAASACRLQDNHPDRTPIVESRVTAQHEARHVIDVIASRHFDVGDPAIDLGSISREYACAGAKRLPMSARESDAEVREIVKIAYAIHPV